MKAVVNNSASCVKYRTGFRGKGFQEAVRPGRQPVKNYQCLRQSDTLCHRADWLQLDRERPIQGARDQGEPRSSKLSWGEEVPGIRPVLSTEPPRGGRKE